MGTAYRYWRLTCSAPSTSSYALALFTIEARATQSDAAPNLFTAGMVCTGTAGGTTGSPASVIDGDDNSYWLVYGNSVDPIWWQVDCGSPVDVQYIKRKDSSGGANTTWFLAGSNDLVSWERRFVSVWPSATSPSALYPTPWPPVCRSSALVQVIGESKPAGRQFASGRSPVMDVAHGGRYRIASTVKAKGSPSNIPLHRRVQLIRERGSLVIRETWSDPVTGDYVFEGISGDYTYTVVSYDYTHNYRAVIADNLTPELMP